MSPTTSKRIRNLRRWIVTSIPKFPNNRDTVSELEEMSLSTLLIHFLSWKSRYVSIRAREVSIDEEATNDQRWTHLADNVQLLLDKAKSGVDLTPHLSHRVAKRGYTPAAAKVEPSVDRWADKDFLLNAMGYHHFHLGVKMEDSGFIERTDDVVFARVSRTEFRVLGIFDHSVFQSAKSTMGPEKKRLWEIFDKDTAQGASPGSVVISSPIATSGHPVFLVLAADHFSQLIREVDSQLDNIEYVRELFSAAGLEMPRNPKLQWRFSTSDLGILEETLGILFVLRRGFN